MKYYCNRCKHCHCHRLLFSSYYWRNNNHHRRHRRQSSNVCLFTIIRRMNIRRRLDQDVYAPFKCVKSFRLCKKKMCNNENQSYSTCQLNTKPLYLKYNVRMYTMNARWLCAKNTQSKKTEELIIFFSFSSLIKLNQTFSFVPIITNHNELTWLRLQNAVSTHRIPSVPISFFRFNFFHFYLQFVFWPHLMSFRFEKNIEWNHIIIIPE